MDIGAGLPEAVGQVLQLDFLVFFMLGVLNGLVFGLLPGLSGSVGIALMIPLTFGLGAGESMALFVAALSGQTFAGSISAILLNTPGTAPNAATTFDGYPLTRQGRGGFALGISATASAVGSLIGVVALVLLFPVIRSIVLAFSFPEFTALIVMGLAAIAMASKGAMIKGLISGALGLMVSFVGFAPMGGELRYVFGFPALWDGISVVGVLIGLFAVSEVMRLLVDDEAVVADPTTTSFGFGQVLEGVRYVFTQPVLLVRSSLVGTGLGIIPAVGGTVAAFLSYFQASQGAKDGYFGQGDPRGVLAPEAANDAKDAGAALPSLAFGLPGSADWAIILGAMVLHGVTPGPNLIRETPEIVWIAVLVITLASTVTSLIGLGVAPYLIRLTVIRPTVLAPVVGALAILGAFALERQFLDVMTVVGVGILGYYMKRFSMPLVPLILGLLLGSQLERAVFQSLQVFDRGPAIFVTRPISLVLVLVTIAIIANSVRQAHRARRSQVADGDAGYELGDIILMSFLFLVSVAAFALAWSFKAPDTRLFPLWMSALAAIMTGFYTVVTVTPALQRRLPWVAGRGQGMGMSRPLPTDEVAQGRGGTGPDRRGARGQSRGSREVMLVGLLLGFALLAWLLGVLLAGGMFMVGTMAWYGREALWKSVLISSVATTLIYVIFVEILSIPLEAGAMSLPFLP